MACSGSPISIGRSIMQRRRSRFRHADLDGGPQHLRLAGRRGLGRGAGVERVQPGSAGPEPAVVAGRAGDRLALFVDVHRIPGQLERRLDVRGQHRDLREPAVRDRRGAQPAGHAGPAAAGPTRSRARRSSRRSSATAATSCQGRLRRRRRPHRALAVVFDARPTRWSSPATGSPT